MQIAIGMSKKDDKTLLQKIPLKLKADILKSKMELTFKFKFKSIINNYSSALLKKKQTKQGMVMLSKASSARDLLTSINCLVSNQENNTHLYGYTL